MDGRRAATSSTWAKALHAGRPIAPPRAGYSAGKAVSEKRASSPAEQALRALASSAGGIAWLAKSLDQRSLGARTCAFRFARGRQRAAQLLLSCFGAIRTGKTIAGRRLYRRRTVAAANPHEGTCTRLPSLPAATQTSAAMQLYSSRGLLPSLRQRAHVSMYRLFSAEHSMFSAKVRAYFRLKADQQDLGRGFEEILATPNLIQNLLQKRSGSPSLPQAETPDGVWLQDTSEIIDHCEQAHRGCPVIPAEDMPRQRLASYLIELLADEWVLVPACWERWQFSLAGQDPNHRAFNEQQWGSFLKPELNGRDRAPPAPTSFAERSA